MKPWGIICVLLLTLLLGCANNKQPDATTRTYYYDSEINPKDIYSPLEVEGRDLYIREGCYNCHSNMVKPLKFENNRYPEYSKRGQFIYDHPFKWGSKRVAADTITRIEEENSAYFLYHKIIHPRYSDSSTIMPSYYFLAEEALYTETIKNKLEALKTLDLPYSDSVIEHSKEILEHEQEKIAKELLAQDQDSLILDTYIELKDQEIIALVAYLKKVRKRVR